MKYRFIQTIVEAVQWFKNGDHPTDYKNDIPTTINGIFTTFDSAQQKELDWEGQVVRRYRHPWVPSERSCERCGRPYHNHGWIDTDTGNRIVCPSNYIVSIYDSKSNVQYHAMDEELFKALFEEMK